MAQGPSDTILVAIRITLRIRESKVRNPDPPDRRRFVLSECILVLDLSCNNLCNKCTTNRSRLTELECTKTLVRVEAEKFTVNLLLSGTSDYS